ncbi:hypothetical protein EVAR_68431_1 [Eumeta japonica]|uniref:Uncharacterized protein n=1 Tax=Eumeta variegata TaxID=151549 RepID=A0A4C2A2Z8_EUMVA|nr:hypothetical protein EVAR_68431_1 [Eumeta japonica]
MRVTRVSVVTAVQSHSLLRRKYQCVAGLLDKNRISDRGRNDLMEEEVTTKQCYIVRNRVTVCVASADTKKSSGPREKQATSSPAAAIYVVKAEKANALPLRIGRPPPASPPPLAARRPYAPPSAGGDSWRPFRKSATAFTSLTASAVGSAGAFCAGAAS